MLLRIRVFLARSRAVPLRRNGVPLVRQAAAAVLVAAGTMVSAQAAYVLQPGDTLEMSVASLSALHEKATIDIDGEVHLPLLPPLHAAGLTLKQMLESLRQELPKKGFRQAQADGRDNFVTIDPDEITLEIASYRPVYVRGDVDKPGEIPFRPGLSVRQAVALAGGYDTMHFHMDNPFMQSSDLRSEHSALWIDYARNRAHALLVDAEVRGAPAPDLTKQIQTPLPRELLANIISVETQRRAVTNADYQKELDYLKRSADEAQQQLVALVKPRDEAQKGAVQDAAYNKSLTDLLTRGVISHDRVTDQQRSLREGTQRWLDYTQRIDDLAKARNSFVRQSEHLVSEHRDALLKDLQEANTQTANVDARLQAVNEKLAYTGTIRSQLVRGDGQTPDIAINHTDPGGASTTQPGSEDTQLAPGDTVEVSLRSALLPRPKLN